MHGKSCSVQLSGEVPFLHQMHQKLFGGWPPRGPAGELRVLLEAA